ncbi:Sak4-like ssDNA annealing protein [Pseudomonas phage Ka3]|uniref:Putative ATPase n=2 Tax=Luzseptimavirus KPP21 TaxID=1982595 RepID=A0A7S6B6G2_9CAUD|nr:Sak4-like ssDNA annealing protein [Pseudomonas phage KPP21]QKE55958.1 putative ATPase [Pseudomonas phage vB_Pae_AM.P2]QWY17806.1 hypothetical protein [Pseudomonas phage vB_Pae-PA152]UGL60902.1 hypothetical protein [Pseudomonas phage vB_PaeS_TUMS_P6]UNI71984.1 hypothetical protein [Pseudomonas phage vB_PaeP_TUMS_P10]WQZ52362.1 Sak4-like ssDNA annealing protein [Pseudomonas phage Ka3]
MTQVNDNLFLISGESATGKSLSLKNLENPEGVIYLNCEAGKKLPFRNKFKSFTITHPDHVYEAFDALENGKLEGHTIVIDTLTYLMDMYESQCVLGSPDTQKAWGNYQQYFKNLMQDYVARSSANVIFLGHTKSVYNDARMMMESCVPVKGALKNNGIESYFSLVISTKKMSLRELEPYRDGNKLLTVSPLEESLGFKHVFQTMITKETIGERIRGPMDMWETCETFINNDAQLVMQRLREYYAG